MTHIDPGVYGAKRATWRSTNPRELLSRIIAAGGDDATWRALFWDEIADSNNGHKDPQWDQLFAIAQYWLDLNIRAVAPRSARTSAASKPAAEIKEQIVKRIEQEAKLILLDLMMPNGKTLGQCTGQDCRRMGGWVLKIAKAVPTKSKVSDVLSETQVRKLWTSK